MPSFRPARTGTVRIAKWQRQHLGHVDRQRIMAAARRLERSTHRRGMHGGLLKRTGLEVLWILLFRGISKHGVCDPALSQIAAWGGMSRATVQAAIKRIEGSGIMSHIKRGVVVAGRWCQWTSAYFMRPLSRWASDTNFSPAEETEKKRKEKREVAPTLPEKDLAALAAKWGLGGAKEAPTPVGVEAALT